jgi:mannose-6-phosphate isomerase class I
MELERRRVKEKTHKSRFQILTCTRGGGAFHFGEKLKSRQPVRKGDTFLMPAHLGDYEVASSGSTEIVVTYVE